MKTTRAQGYCDLCGQHEPHRRFEAAAFGLVGWLCGGCVEELQDEELEGEHAAIRAAWVEPARPGDLSELLTVLSPPFRLNDLALHAVIRLEVAAAKRRTKRLANYQPKVVVPPPPGPPCATCGTTGGALLASERGPLRLEGAKYGSPGRHCKACYSRIHRPTSLLGRVSLAS